MLADFTETVSSEQYDSRYLFYGTTEEGLKRLKENGLKPSTKCVDHVCLYADYGQAKRTAGIKSMKNRSQPIVLYIDRDATSEMSFERENCDHTRYKHAGTIISDKLKKVSWALDFLLTL